jgi:hypothetical protein
MLNGLYRINLKLEKIITKAILISILFSNSLQEDIEKKLSNSTMSFRTNSKDFEPTLILSDTKHQTNIDEVSISQLECSRTN